MFSIFENTPNYQPIKVFKGLVRAGEFLDVLKEWDGDMYITDDQSYLSNIPMTTYRYYCTEEPNKPFWNNTRKHK